MTVILLREVLMEIGVSFKSIESKANLIEKGKQARQMQNDTFDDNWPATVTSINSVNLHRGITRGNNQLFFFPQEQFFVTLEQYTLKSAGQDNS